MNDTGQLYADGKLVLLKHVCRIIKHKATL
jgi:hypothetical protein